MKPLEDIAVLAATACESASAIALLRGAGTPALLLHLIACGCGAALLHRRLLAGPAPWSFALLFGVAVFIPFLGAAGVVTIALATPGNVLVADPDCVATRIPRPPGPGNAGRSPDAGLLSGARGMRLAALGALRSRCDPEAVASLRRALEDGDEDVRLLAHAMLESRNREACREIGATTAELSEAPEERRGPLHRRLASQYWEVARLGLLQGECLDHALQKARHHAKSALEHDPHSASLHFLLGRIELRLAQLERARVELFHARELGLPAGVAGPYLAEAAFLARRFDVVADHLRECEGVHAGGPTERLRRFWT